MTGKTTLADMFDGVKWGEEFSREEVEVIARSVHQAATGSQRIVVSIRAVENLSRDAAAEAENVSAATEEQSASMQEIAASSQALAKLAEELKVAVARFRV